MGSEAFAIYAKIKNDVLTSGNFDKNEWFFSEGDARNTKWFFVYYTKERPLLFRGDANYMYSMSKGNKIVEYTLNNLAIRLLRERSASFLAMDFGSNLIATGVTSATLSDTTYRGEDTRPFNFIIRNIFATSARKAGDNCISALKEKGIVF